jgi:hypothetical protein
VRMQVFFVANDSLLLIVLSYFTCNLSVFSELLLSKLDEVISEPFIKQSDKVKLSKNKNVVCSYFCF